MHRLASRALFALCAASVCFAASATRLRVVPVLVEPAAGVRTGTVTLTNEQQRPMRAQFRVMRWTVENGRDVLQPTQDVVVSPPQVTLAPRQEYVVRVVNRRAPPAGREESYRLVVDELPDPMPPRRPGTVNLVLRQSIPVFFSDVGGARPTSTGTWSGMAAASGWSAAIPERAACASLTSRSKAAIARSS